MAEYDIVLLSGRVIDPETMCDQVSNVGVKGGRISEITKEQITGKINLDCTGHVISPGFIDTHHHFVYPLGTHLGVLDGRTSLFDLEMGCVGGKVDYWYKSRENALYCNYGTGSSHELARASVLDGFKAVHGDTLDARESRKASGWTATKPDLQQANKILELVDEGFQAGAVGASSTAGYMREGVSAREIFELVKVAAAYGCPTAMHFRGTPGTEVAEVNGIQELLCNAVALGAPAIACHFNNPGYNLVHEMLISMQDKGCNVWGEVYPYAAGCTALNAEFLKPDYWCKHLGHKYEDTLQDPDTGKFLTEEEYHEKMKTDPTHIINVFKMPVECEVEWMKLRNEAIAPDSMPIVEMPFMLEDVLDVPYDKMPNAHPRLAGCYGKALRLARESNIPLMHMISMCSYTPAMRLGKTGLKAMQERGRMQVGMVADITVFDPETVADKATYKQGTIPTVGISHVLVNGTLVVKDGKIVPRAYAGQPIRHDLVTDGRKSKPIDVETWKHVYTVMAKVDFGGSDPQQTFTCCDK